MLESILLILQMSLISGKATQDKRKRKVPDFFIVYTPHGSLSELVNIKKDCKEKLL